MARPLQALAHPFVAFPLFVVTQWLFHVGPLFRAAERSATVHGVEHVAMLTTGILFWLPVIGHAPLRRRLRGVERSLYLAFVMPPYDLIGVWYIATGRRDAGAAMLAGCLPIGFAFIGVGWEWMAREHRRQLRREALGA
jgi:cytochrome c oxidase assembly factor CtaG